MPERDYSATLVRTDTGCELELVPEFGGLINRLQLSNGETSESVIAGLPNRAAMMADRGFRGVSLFPFANRLDAGRYSHAGKQYEFAVNEPERNNALHGFLFRMRPQTQQLTDKPGVRLTYEYGGDNPGYPFPAEVVITYVVLAEGALEVTFKVTNRHVDTIPVGIGWHPYFTLGSAVDELDLQLPLVAQVQVDERMLPTGHEQELPEELRSNRIGSRNFDNCFKVNAPTEGVTHTMLWSNRKHVGLELWQQTGKRGFNFIQVCNAPDRQSIAIEPVSCGIDAFNSGDGVILLDSGESFEAQCGVRLLQHKP